MNKVYISLKCFYVLHSQSIFWILSYLDTSKYQVKLQIILIIKVFIVLIVYSKYCLFIINI